MDAKKASGYFASGYPGCCRAEAAQGPRVARLSAERRMLAWLRTPEAIRERCHALLALAERMPWRISRSMPRGWTMPRTTPPR